MSHPPEVADDGVLGVVAARVVDMALHVAQV